MTDEDLKAIAKRISETPSPERVAVAVNDRRVVAWIAFAQADLPALLEFAQKAKAMLREVQADHEGTCLVCAAKEAEPHRANCALAALIR